MRIRVVSENEYMSLTVALIPYLRFAVVELAGSIKHAINNTLGTEALIVQKAKAFSTTGVFFIFLGLRRSLSFIMCMFFSFLHPSSVVQYLFFVLSPVFRN